METGSSVKPFHFLLRQLQRFEFEVRVCGCVGVLPLLRN
jgi:hypothetical protein